VLAVVAVTLAALGVTLAGPTAAGARPERSAQVAHCYWLEGHQGTRSNCDGVLWSDKPACTWDVPSNPVRTARLGSVATVRLWHSQNCRTVDAEIIVHQPGASCYAKVARHQPYGEDAQRGNPWTPMLYARGKTTYAYGHCTYGGTTYQASTGTYAVPQNP
jgi:hypothetical protein